MVVGCVWSGLWVAVGGGSCVSVAVVAVSGSGCVSVAVVVVVWVERGLSRCAGDRLGGGSGGGRC